MFCCFRGASSPAVKSMCESSSWPSNLCKQGSPWHLKKQGEYYASWDQKRDSVNWNVLNEQAFVLWALCHIAPTNVRRLFCIISLQSRCIALASSHMSIGVLKISDLVMLYNHSNTRLMFCFTKVTFKNRWDIIRWQVKLSLFATYWHLLASQINSYGPP